MQNLKKSVCYGVKGIIYVKNESIKNLLGGGSQIIVRPSSSGETPPESSDIIESNTIDKVRLHEVLSGFAGSVSFSGSKCTDSSAIDISQGQNGSIKVVKGDDKAVIYQEGGVKAPTDSSGLFKGLFDYRWTQCSLNLDNLDTSDVTDMSGMFSGCQYLDYLELSNLDTSNVTDMSGMFQGCNDLEAIDVSNFNTSKVKDMGGMFAGCNDLTSLDVSSFDTSKVTNMGSMFSACQKLTSIDISNFDTSNVTDMYGMFEYCSGLTSLDLSNFDTKNVTDITDMFYHCSEINSLDLSSFDTRSIESASSMFAFCYKLRKIDLSSFYFTDKQMRGIATADTNRLVSSFSESATIYVKNEEMKLKLGSYNRENGGKYCTFVIK